MPLSATGAIGLSLTVQDYTGEKSDMTIYFPSNLSIDGILGELTAAQAIGAGLTDGFIVGGSISQSLVQTDAFGDGPPATSDVNRKGIFTFRNSAGTYNKYEIPSIDRALLTKGSNAIDLTELAVSAYVQLMLGQAQLGALVGRPTSKAGLLLSALNSAKEFDRNTDPNR